MRDSLFMDELQLSVKALKGGAPWDAVRSMHPGVAPVAMDASFKAICFSKAGLPLPPPSEIEIASKKAAEAAAKRALKESEDEQLSVMLAAEAAKASVKSPGKKSDPLT